MTTQPHVNPQEVEPIWLRDLILGRLAGTVTAEEMKDELKCRLGKGAK